jgi:hypothetical protein
VIIENERCGEKGIYLVGEEYLLGGMILYPNAGRRGYSMFGEGIVGFHKIISIGYQ